MSEIIIEQGIPQLSDAAKARILFSVLAGATRGIRNALEGYAAFSTDTRRAWEEYAAALEIQAALLEHVKAVNWWDCAGLARFWRHSIYRRLLPLSYAARKEDYDEARAMLAIAQRQAMEGA
jgi:hypothetical protein